ncbi:branched-chain amino acid ABC transporter ATP-binding protein/permease [Pseudofrankia sp. BMG5.37]|uniref:branched-chain amino acid ABC transporter ATP-binding protein/permease n=1 Tax=Pseudofrankia sp. BMG5.37 TaxID=3050035 RepID=UPI0028952AFB|nr:branched-chain amino acid ABC transporter ATP-binding protein/permease [Pseudofrankia sp. BMG5.37]MDT3441832.1 branched-chain amino acid ABC transporter ATP-binding protein/permease [Pseudofrankia sp. BMG5.37]
MTARAIRRSAALVGLPILALLSGDYYGGQLAQFLVLGAATAALALAWGTSGILNLGHSVTFGAGAYAGAWFGLHVGAAGSLAGLVAGAAVGGLLAFLVAWLPFRRGLPPMTFALATFVFALGAEQVANGWTSVTGGFNGLTDVPRLHLGAAALSPAGQRAFTVFVAVAAIVALSHLASLPLGAALAATRDHQRRTASLGYHVVNLKTGVFACTGALAGFLGAIFVLQVGFVSPGLVGVAMATSFVVWALLGSKGTIVGPAVATIGYNIGASELADRALDYWLLGTGLVVVGAVLFLPEGLALWVRRWLPTRRPPRQVRLGRADEREAGLPGANPAGDGAVALDAAGVVCRFGAFTAVDGVSLTLRPGEVHCLIGPNGAGKSTLLNVLSGVTPANGGRWRVGKRDLTGAPAWELARAGAARKFQTPSLATSLTVGENLALARWGPTHRWLALLRQPWSATVSPAAWTVLATADLIGQRDTVAGDLSHGQRQLVELAMALAPGPAVLLLDEPTAGMTRAETAAVGELLTELAHRQRIAILVVEHDTAFIRGVADRVTVMAGGAVLVTGTPAEVDADPRVRAVYVGRAS